VAKPGRWERIKRAFAHPEAKRLRADALENTYLGFGTDRDKTAAGAFAYGYALSDYELDALYYFDDIAAKIVNAKPAEMLRRGYRLRSDDNPDAADVLQAAGKALEVDTKVLRAMQWGRLRGGALLIIGANDAADLRLPLEPGKVRAIKFLNVVDKRYATVYAYQENPNLPRHGEPELYAINGSLVHASRVVRFDGVPETDPTMRRQLGGWTHSALQRPYDVLRSFASSFKSIEHLVADASQGVFKLQNLIDAIASNKEALQTRLALLDMHRSAGRAIFVDAETEGFERVATSFSGLDSIIDRLMMRLSAAADLPVTLLMGRSPAGMNATGDSDFRAWYDDVAVDRENELTPALLALYRVIGGGTAPDDLAIDWPPLWEPTEKERAETEKVRADADNIYVTMGAVLPEEVAIARFGSGNGKIEIDEEALEKSRDQEIELMTSPKPEAPVVPAAQVPDPNAPEEPADDATPTEPPNQ
jgi:phage-related protein (TIGR01555 family)